MAIISADELAHDLPGAEAMMVQYKEHRAEVDSRKEAFTKFNQTGQAFLRNKHFLSDEVNIDSYISILYIYIIYINPYQIIQHLDFDYLGI